MASIYYDTKIEDMDVIPNTNTKYYQIFTFMNWDAVCFLGVLICLFYFLGSNFKWEASFGYGTVWSTKSYTFPGCY
jgi:hypothetical protein